MKKRVKILLIFAAVLFLIITAASLIFSHMAGQLETYLSQVEITPVDLEVDITDHSIRDIRLIKHRNGRGSEAEKIIPRIIDEQRIDVDTVSGATYSCLVIQDALIKALE